MTKSLADLQTLCIQHDIEVPPQRRAAKEPYLLALRDHFWSSENPDRPLPEQILPMLLGDWNDLDGSEAVAIEADGSGWCVQEKLDGIRVLLHITEDCVRLTGRNISEVTFRLSELLSNVPHLANGFEHLAGTILDGELVCPKASIDTGDTITTHQLQAAVAILATSPEKATAIQEQQDAHLRFFAFDVLRFRGQDISEQSLSERLKMLDTAYLMAENSYLRLVETQTEAKSLFHELTLSEGKEGTVWKKLDEPYEAGQRVRHWLKRKKGIEVVAEVTGFKPGTKGKGNEHLVGAIEFSTASEGGGFTPIAWVSSWTDEERREMTRVEDGIITLNPNILGRKAIVGGHDIAGKSGRVRHARLVQWIENPLVEAADVTKPTIEDELARLAA